MPSYLLVTEGQTAVSGRLINKEVRIVTRRVARRRLCALTAARAEYTAGRSAFGGACRLVA